MDLASPGKRDSLALLSMLPNVFSLAPFHLYSGQVKSDNGSVVFGSCTNYINDRLQLVSVLVFFPKAFIWLC